MDLLEKQQYADFDPLKTGLSKPWFKINCIWSKIRKKTKQVGHQSDFG